MKIYLKILLLLLPEAVNAQMGHVDSLHKVLRNAQNDSVRMDINNSIGIFYAETNRDTSLFYRERALGYARKLNLKVDEADIMVGQSYMLSVMGNFATSMHLLLGATRILEDPSNEKNPFHLTEAQSALNTRMSTLSVAYFILGNLYGFAGNRSKKMSYYRKSIDISEALYDSATLGYTYASMGIDYINHADLDSAVYFEQKALSLYKNVKGLSDSKYEGMAYLYLGMIYQKMGKIDQAKQAFTSSIALSDQRNNMANLGFTYVALSRLYEKQNMLDSGLYCAKKGLSVAQEVGEPLATAEAYSQLSDIYSTMNLHDSAFISLKSATVIKERVAEASKKNIDVFQNMGFDEQFRVQELEKEKAVTQSRNRTFGFISGLVVFMMIALLLYRNNLQKQKANLALKKTLLDLKSTQAQLIQSEKMASLGELTAGIAHEIQNPLNFVNNFSEVSIELMKEMVDEAEKGNTEEVKSIVDDIIQNLEKINHHGKRADAIVKGMLQHSRTTSATKEQTDINKLADEYLRLAYHGIRAKDKSFNATLKTDYDESIGNISIISQDIGRVILNLLTNAFYAVAEKKKQKSLRTSEGETSASRNEVYEAIVSVTTRRISRPSGGWGAEITVTDNGNGIPSSVKEKIFQPFFTTKPTGQGTGLGLSLAYDIVKVHGGELKVETKEGEGTTFIVNLPMA